MNIYDDFFNEPNEFDMQLGEFKESLLKSVKEEYVSEMERLRKEISELKEFRQQKKMIEREIASIKRQAELDKEEAIREAKRSRFIELMGGFDVEMWTPEYYYMEARKCDRCDDERKIHFITPLGNESYELCTCNKKITVYQPAKNILRKISTRNRYGEIQSIWFYYSLSSDEDYDSVEYRTDDVAENLFIPGVTSFEEVEGDYYRRYYFSDFNDCQRYCMWKMQKDAGILPKATDSTESAQSEGRQP